MKKILTASVLALTLVVSACNEPEAVNVSNTTVVEELCDDGSVVVSPASCEPKNSTK